ncbi:hypothetical protein [Streptomyces sp. NPDC059881]|uniref:hypothetical protein n=1 Tax=Streptomyces sp. NPDC059881 TaxID=3346986 RepID=UPI003654E9EA
MSAQLRETATGLAEVLWREHTVYRDRAGGVVIRGEHVQRWISLAPGGGRDEILVRAGRILDGGTTAPARAEAVVSLAAGTSELAAVCRRLLAEAAADAMAGAMPKGGASRSGRTAKRSKQPKGSRSSGRPSRPRRSGRTGRHTSFGSWMVIVCVVALVALYAYSMSAAYR